MYWIAYFAIPPAVLIAGGLLFGKRPSLGSFWIMPSCPTCGDDHTCDDCMIQF